MNFLVSKRFSHDCICAKRRFKTAYALSVFIRPLRLFGWLCERENAPESQLPLLHSCSVLFRLPSHEKHNDGSQI